MSVAVCPTPADLERLFLGGLVPADADALEQHVLQCNSCLARLEQLFRAKETLAVVLCEKTRADSLVDDPVVADLIKKVASLRPVHPQGNVMITMQCSACNKKLSVKEDAAGKKVKCPGCGQLTAVPAALKVGAKPIEEMRTLPPTPPMELSADAPPADPDADPTHPPSEKPDATLEGAPHDHDASLVDFLAPPQAADELGRLGKYRILKILGHGGMGVVYKAEDPKLERTVAIKAMLPTLAASASAGKRFLREARVMAKVEHDHIVRIYQVDDERGIPFMAMEFLKGEPLDDCLKREEALPVEEILRIGREIAEGLGAAHAIGLIHRDIKPGNIWLEAARGVAPGATPQAAGRVKILDFGLARAASQEAGLTQQGAIIGTPAYMAPEQGRGENVDARCDLFSLGVVLYRMCTGQQPFQGRDTVSTLMAVAMNDPVAPSKLNKSLPAGLSELVMKLLEKDPAKRIGSAAEVVASLQALERELARKRETAIGATGRKQAIDQAIFALDEPKATAKPSSPLSESPTTDLPPIALRRKPRSLKLAGIALAALFFGLLGAGIYYWQTNNGVVRIEFDDPNIKVTFDKDGAIIAGAAKHEIKLRAGEHAFTVEQGDLKFDTDKFILKRGEIVTLKIEMMKGPLLVVTRDGKQIGKIGIEVAQPPPIANPPALAARNALAFSGEDAVSVPSIKLDPRGPITIEAYVRCDSVAPGKAYNPHFVGVPDGLAIYLGHDGSDLRAGCKLADKEFYRVVRKEVWKLGERLHVAAVRTKTRFTLFVNGQEAGRKELPDGELFPAEGPFQIGGRINGEISEVRVSKTARYTKNFTPQQRFEPDKDTLALFHMDEGGDKLIDSSGNGHHGKIVGAKWVGVDGAPAAPPIDLLAAVEIPRDLLHGSWKKEGAALLHDGLPASGLRLFTPKPMPEEYDIDMTVERLEDAKRGGMAFGFLFGGNQATVNLDAGGRSQASLWGLEQVDGLDVFKNPTRVDGLRLPLNEKKAVRIEIRKASVRVFCDQDKIIDWTGQPGQLSPPPYWKIPAGTLYLGGEAKLRVHKLTLTPLAPNVPATPAQIAAKKQQEEWAAKLKLPMEATNKLGMKLILIPPAGDALPNPYYLGKYEVTQGEWQNVMGYNPSEFGPANPKVAGLDTSKFPVENVSWFDSVEFCNKLSERQGLKPYYELKVTKRGGKHIAEAEVKILGGSGYHIPTDAEWEHGCRAGTKTKYHCGDKAEELLEYAWFDKNSDGRTHAVGEKKPNAFGLHDMHGNVREWNEEMLTNAASGNPERANRGGSWDYAAGSCAVSHRRGFPPAYRFDVKAFLGLRVARVADGSAPAAIPPLDPAPAAPKKFTNSLGMQFARIPRGKAWFGGGTGGKPGNVGTKEIEFRHDFYLGVYEVTQGEWEKVMGKNPSAFSRNGASKDAVKNVSDDDLKRFPVDSVTHDECRAFVKKLNEMTKEQGWVYRLPTENEWEYAARGGPMTDKAQSAFDPFFKNGGKVNADSKGPVKVGSYAPNRLGLHDMYGNVWEYAHSDDRFAGPRGIMGGSWAYNWGSLATGHRGAKSWEGSNNVGLRVARIPLAMVALDPAWLKAVAALKPEQQVEAVKAELMKRNLGFDGKVKEKIGAGVVTELQFLTDDVTDISPVRALTGLQSLIVQGSAFPPNYTERNGKLADLSPLKGMNLTNLRIRGTQVSDLSPLNGMELTSLECGRTDVSDLSPLKDMKLTFLSCGITKVSDLSPLKDMKLTYLACEKTLVFDLSPLKDMRLTTLQCSITKVSDLSALKGMPLAKLSCNRTKVTDLSPLIGMPLKTLFCDFTAKRDAEILRSIMTLETINGKDAKEVLKGAETSAFPPLDPDWLKAVAAMNADQQIKAVKAELMKRNPGFDGAVKYTLAANDTVEFLALPANNIKDISPVRALPELRYLHCFCENGQQGLDDLSPLQGTKLTVLDIHNTKVADLSPLSELKLTYLRCDNIPAGYAEKSPYGRLVSMPLIELRCNFDAKRDAEILRSIKTLRAINQRGAESFWKEVDGK